MTMLTTEQVPELLGVMVRRVQRLVQSGKLSDERLGRAIVVRESDLSKVAHH